MLIGNLNLPSPTDPQVGDIMPVEVFEEKVMLEREVEEEGRDPIAILPEEVWEIILGMLKDSPKDLVSCCRASLSWDWILNSSKGTWLFKKVFPHVYTYLDKKDILNCRQVCKKWRYAVDFFLENHPCHQPSAPEGIDDGDNRRESVYYPLISKQLYQIRFVEPAQLTKFKTEMEHHVSNPLLGRSVSFYSQPHDEWMVSALQFLSAFGKHIWYFSFESAHPPVRFIQWLRQCLALLPNLKKLHIICLITAPTENENEAEGLEEMMEDLRTNPMPELPHLESLEICTNNLPKMIQDTLIATYSRQIYRLQLNEWNEIYTTEESYPFVRLKELHLTVDSNECLDSLLHLSCPELRKLNITLRHSGIDLEKLFQVMQRFGEKMEVLKLSLSPGASFLEDSPEEVHTEPFLSKLYLPCLKTLVLVNVSNLSYNFLVGMKCLEYLHLEKWSSEPLPVVDIEEELVQIHYFVDCDYMYDSNIWERLPSLKHMTYYELSKDRQKYNRRMFNYLQQMRRV